MSVKSWEPKRVKLLITVESDDKKDPDCIKRFSVELKVDSSSQISEWMRQVGDAVVEAIK